MTVGAQGTDAQADAIKRLTKRHGELSISHFDSLGRLVVYLPGDEEPRRRRRFITRSGVVERGN